MHISPLLFLPHCVQMTRPKNIGLAAKVGGAPRAFPPSPYTQYLPLQQGPPSLFRKARKKIKAVFSGSIFLQHLL